MICPYCNNPARWVDNKEIYGRNYGKSYKAWFCKPCGAYVGCHQNSRKPLGTMADAETREWRKKAHKAFDPLWQLGRHSRDEAYRMIGNRHIGESDVEQCREIIEAVREIST